MKLSLQACVVATFTCCALISARAQDPLQSLLYSAGTSARTPAGADWAYLLWASAAYDTIAGKSFAIYGKAGDPASPGSYTRRAIAQLQTDPAVISTLIQRALNLGEVESTLNSEIDFLFGQLRPTVPLAEKLSVVLRALPGDQNLYGRLLLLGRNHPAITLCMGLGHAEPIPAGATTFEIRLLDGAGQEQGVVGRVTVTAGAPVVLPAPGAPVEVQEPPARKALGHLNAKLRWTAPDALKRLGLLSQGFNLYRVTRAYAEQQGWHNNPPARGVLALRSSQVPDVTRVNSIPILTPPDTGNPQVAFVMDDNGAGGAGRPFRNGEVFYYFLTARDLLGRDGETSPGTRVMLCDRVMPQAPVRVFVENTVITPPGQPLRQALRVRWDASPVTDEGIARYHVYRWTNSGDPLRDILPAAGHPNRIATITPLAGQASWIHVDDGPNSPQMPRNSGQTFFYTIRAEDDGACGGNLSAHSGPMFGVLRDRDAPIAPAAALQFWSCQPQVRANLPGSVEIANPDPNQVFYRLACSRPANEWVAWVEFYQGAPDAPQRVHRESFAPGTLRLEFLWTIDRATAQANRPLFHCRVGTVNGDVSPLVASQPATIPPVGTLQEHQFVASTDCRLVGGGVFDPTLPGSPTNQCISIPITASPDTREVRVYRQTDGGELTLVTTAAAGSGTVTDCFAPPVGATVCYYVQALDQNGNPSAMVPTGDCVPVRGTDPLPTPTLLPLRADGNFASPRMLIRWSCPIYGLQRFRVYLATENGQAVEGQISALLIQRLGVDINSDFRATPAGAPIEFGEYESAAIWGALGDGPDFSVSVAIEPARRYFVFVRAVSNEGLVGPSSQVGSYIWAPPANDGPDVPWPAWPVVGATRDPRFVAQRLPGDEYPLGVQIGSLELPAGDQPAPRSFIGRIDATGLLFRTAQNQSVAPLMIYRYQVANAAFPRVSGDVVQASPLLEQIAHEHRATAGGGFVTVIHDPFIELFQVPNTRTVSIVLRDTQPVISGARYVYIVTRFDPVTREIIESIPTNPIEP